MFGSSDSYDNFIVEGRLIMALPFILGAYASHPAPELEADYYRLLADQPWVSGVEIPYPGQLATQGEVLASHLAAHWDFNTITAIPGTMQNVWKNENFGLASPDEAGQAGRPRLYPRAARRPRRPVRRAGRLLVGRVQLHSAPTRLAHAEAFKRSLDEVAALGLEWGDPRRRALRQVHARTKPRKGFPLPRVTRSTSSPRSASASTSTGVAPPWKDARGHRLRARA